MNWGTRTFLERVSLAAREPVYSAALAWALDEQSPLPLSQRLGIVEAFAGLEIKGGTSMIATTEWNDVDLLLTIAFPSGPIHVAIENKIKAVERKQQLAVYDQVLAQLPGRVVKLFVTLTGEMPLSGVAWQPVTYGKLLEALRLQSSTSVYVTDLCEAIARLVSVADSARADETVSAIAFGDADAPDATEISSYIEEMRLQKVVQRVWMAELGRRLAVGRPWTIAIGETRGQALLNVDAALSDRVGFVVGMQLQSRTLKAFCHPSPYPTKATQDQHDEVEAILGTMKAALSLPQSAKPSSRKSRGFRSYSVATLPPIRNHDTWLSVVSVHVLRLVSTFHSVQASALADDGLREDDE